MKAKKILSLFMIGVMFSANIPFNVFAEDITNDTTITEDELVSGSALNISDSNIDFEFNVTGQWEGGFNGEIKISNLTDAVIENWQIQMEFPQEITNIWNAAIESHEGTVYNIRNAGNNNNVNIPVGESVTFGFSGTYEDSITSPSNVKLVQSRADVDEEAYTIEYSLLSDWGSGYSAQITITNNTNKPFEAWYLAFDFDRNIDSIWNAVIEEHIDNKYYISNADYNSVIPANSKISFGFNGSGGTSENVPADYCLTISGINNEKNIDPDIEEVEILNADYYLTDIIYAPNDSKDFVTNDVILPQIGFYGSSSVEWESSDTNIINTDGNVIRPKDCSKIVTLTATFTEPDGQILKKEYPVKVIKEFKSVALEQTNLSTLKNLNDEMPFIWIDPETSKIRYLEGNYTDYIAESPQEVIYSLNALKSLYGIKSPEEEYICVDFTSFDDITRYRLQQIYKGVSIYGSQLIITTDKTGGITSIIGWYENLPQNLSEKPTHKLSDVNYVINAPTNNTDFELMFIKDNNQYLLCWNVYNPSNGKRYYINDFDLSIITSFKDEWCDNAYNSQDNTYSIITETENNTDKYRSANPDKDKILSIYAKPITVDLKYVEGLNVKDIEYDGENDLHIFRTTAEGETYLFGPELFVNFAKINYGKYICVRELFDTKYNVDFLNKDDENKIIEYSQKNDKDCKEYFYEAIHASNNVRKSLDYLLYISGDDNITLMKKITGEDIRYKNGLRNPLYVLISAKENESVGSFNSTNRTLKLCCNGSFKGYEHTDVIVHELTHGLMHNEGKLNSDTKLKNTIHEAYGDILGCLQNDDWCFEKDRKGKDNNTTPRFIGRIAVSNGDPNGKFKVIKDESVDNNILESSMQPYYNSTILSCAAYRMNKDSSCGTNINNAKLARIWYRSISRLRSGINSMDEIAFNVLYSAVEENCSEDELDCIKTAFNKAKLGELKQFNVYVNDIKNKPIENAVIGISLPENTYNYIESDNITLLNVYDETISSFEVECYAEGYNRKREIWEVNPMINIQKKYIKLDAEHNQSNYGRIYLQVKPVTGLEEYGFKIDGLSVILYNAINGNIIYLAGIDSTGKCEISNIPKGNYYIGIYDNRELEEESKRFEGIGAYVGINGDNANLTATVVNKYKFGGIYLYYENNSDKTETPVTSSNVIIKDYNGTVWTVGGTNENGIINWFYEENKSYKVYVDGEFFIDIEE